MIMRKKQTAQSCGTGIMDTALGKAMKASPGPVRTRDEQLGCAQVRKNDPEIQLGQRRSRKIDRPGRNILQTVHYITMAQVSQMGRLMQFFWNPEKKGLRQQLS